MLLTYEGGGLDRADDLGHALSEGLDLGFQRVAGNEFTLRLFARNGEISDLVVATA